MGYGYTDESITRLSPEKALEYLEKSLGTVAAGQKYWEKENQNRPRDHAATFALQYAEEKQRMEEEIALLKSR